MSKHIKIIECPRDAWQGLPGVIPAEIKAEYLRRLIHAGFRHIDAVSFVAPKAVPQMADSETVLRYLDPPDDVEIIGVVVNEKGADRAIRTGSVETLGFPYSISPEFLRRNQNQTPEEAVDALDAITMQAHKAGLDLVAYISMAFGNPYGDPWSISDVVDACDLLVDSGIEQISLADTVGLATPSLIADTIHAVLASYSEIEIGVHLHARQQDAPAKIEAAFLAGCTRFDSAIGGLGGCPFAQDELVGNIPTELLLSTLGAFDAVLPSLLPIKELLSTNARIKQIYSQSHSRSSA